MQLSAAEAYEILTRAGTFKAAAGMFRALAAAERDADQSGRADRMPGTSPAETIQRIQADERRGASKTKRQASVSEPGGFQQLKVVLGNGVAAKRCDQDGPAEEA